MIVTFLFGGVFFTNTGRVSAEGPETKSVSNQEQLEAALVDDYTTIIIESDFSVDEKINITRPVTIDGENHTISFSTTTPKIWSGAYIFQVYKTTATIKDINLTGGNVALFVNGSTVNLMGRVNVSGNGFGGIESSSNGSVPAILTISTGANLVNTSEAYGLPTVWEDALTGTTFTSPANWTTTKAVKPNQVQYYVDAKNSVISNQAELELALANLNNGTIVIGKDFSVDKKIDITRPLTINGGGHTISFLTTAPSTWSGAYIFQVYKTTATIKDINLTGGNAALLVNGSAVTLTGKINVSDNGFGGIESSYKDLTPSMLTVSGATLVNTSEAYGFPTVWEDGTNGNTLSGFNGITNKIIKPTQVQYYLDVRHTDNIAPTVSSVTHDESAKTITYTFSEAMKLTNNDGTEATLTPDKLAVYAVTGLDYATASKVNGINIIKAELVDNILTITYTGNLVAQVNTKYVVDAWGYKIVDLADNRMLPDASQMFNVTGDPISPIGGELKMVTLLNPNIIVSPINNVYTLPALSITGVDVFQSLSVIVTDDNLNTDKVPVFIDGTANGFMVYSGAGNLWNYAEQTAVLPDFSTGTHNLVATFKDNSGNETKLTAKFSTDNTAPIITILGTNPVTLTQGDVYTEAGATATDNIDTTVTVTTSGAVATSTVGIYQITYTAIDAAGNTASTTRTVNVVAPAPVISYGGGGSSATSYCSTVTYGEWGTNANGIQYRDVLTQTPNSCSLTAEQTSARSRNYLNEISEVAEPTAPIITPETTSTSTQQVLGEKKFADGTLLRGTDNKIYVVMNNTLGHITSLKELAKYAGKTILKTEDSVIASFSKTAVLGVKKYANGTLIKAEDDVKIYVIKAGKKVHVKSLAELRQLKGKTLTVEASELNNY